MPAKTQEYLSAKPTIKKAQVHLNLDPAIKKALVALSRKYKLSLNATIERALAYFLDANRKGE